MIGEPACHVYYVRDIPAFHAINKGLMIMTAAKTAVLVGLERIEPCNEEV